MVAATLVGILGLLVLPRAVAARERGGIKAGSFLLRPSVDAELRYDSNVFRRNPADKPDGSGDIDPVAAPLVALLPSVALETRPKAKVRLKGTVGLQIRQYVHDDAAVDAQSNFGAHARLDGGIGRDRPIGLDVSEHFAFQPEPGTDQEFLDNVATFDRVYNRLRVAVPVRPGVGVLDFRPGYTMVLSRFLEFEAANKTSHSLSLDGRWRFMPKTALILRSSLGWHSVENDYVDDSMPLRVTVGLRGLITSRLSLDVEAGYGNSFTDDDGGTNKDGESFSSVIGMLSVTHRITERMSVKGSYRRDFVDSSWSNFYDSHLFSLQWLQQVRGDVQIVAGLFYELQAFAPLDAQAVADMSDLVQRRLEDEDRFDQLLRVDASVEWRPNSWLSIRAGYQLEDRITDEGSRIAVSEYQQELGAPPTTINEAAYVKHQVYTRVGLHY